MKKMLIASLSVSIFVVLAITFMVLFGGSKVHLSNQSNNSLEICNSLIYNGDDKINIVFLSDKKTVREYSDYLFSITPFSSNKDKFNILYIDSYQPECQLYKSVALLCYSKELTKKASSCKSDYVIALENKPAEIRSSSYMNVISINKNNPKTVLPHELSHALANLADEYVPADIPSGSKNCLSKCTLSKENCFDGCSKSNYYRTINQGIMRSLNSKEFGSFDESLIQESINSQTDKRTGITGNAISEINCNGQSYYLLTGTLKDNSIQIKNKEIEKGCVGNNGYGQFNHRIILNDNTILGQESFNPEFIFTDSQNGQMTIDGSTFSSDIEFYVKVPAINDAKTLEIYNEDTKVGETKLNDIGAIPCKLV
ncbi:hypothetical protein J4217_02095 [Candidatus Pacearchaeota archaeon]|nr:hypothetical protein [Candidatus Pacearchaeota archaeon]